MIGLKLSNELKMNIIGNYIREKRKIILKLTKKYKLSEATIRKEINKYETRKVLMRK